MQAVILAAGVGSRLSEATNGLPKCLIPIGDKTLIQHQLEALSDAGIGKILIVTGYKSDKVRAVVGNQATYIQNDRYAETNSLYSLSLASEWITGSFVLMNCDVLFHPDILHRLLAKNGNALTYDSTSAAGQEQTKVALREDRVIDLGKDLPKEISRGESLGVLRFDAEGSKDLFGRAKALTQNGGEKNWVMEAVRGTCSSLPVRGVNVAGLPWAEIDFPYDLNRAQKEIWPAIKKSKWKKTIHWHKVKWMAAGIIALLLIGFGWLLNFISPTPTWTTVLPLNAKEYILNLSQGSQQWWVASSTDTIQTIVYGPSTIRVEVRLLFFSPVQNTERYVVEVSLDGGQKIWKVFKSTPEKDISTAGLTIGDRDRIEFEIPPGNHTVAVSLLAGNCDQFLARVRYPEMDTDEDDNE